LYSLQSSEALLGFSFQKTNGIVVDDLDDGNVLLLVIALPISRHTNNSNSRKIDSLLAEEARRRIEEGKDRSRS